MRGVWRLLLPRFFAVLLLAVLLGSCQKAPVQAIYYYESYCESCHDDVLFGEEFAKTQEDLGTRVALTCVNTARKGRGSYDRDCERAGIPEEKRVFPALFLGDAVMMGADAIESTLRIELARLGRRDGTTGRAPAMAGEGMKAINGNAVVDEERSGGIQVPNPRAASNPSAPARPSLPVTEPGESLFLYFSTSPCQACSRASQALSGLPERISLDSGGETALRIERRSIVEDENLALLTACFDAWNVPSKDRQVPIVFYADGYRTSEFEGLAGIVSRGGALGFAAPEPLSGAGAMPAVDWAATAVGGLVAGLNPCALSMCLFVLSIAAERKRALSALWYVAGHTAAQLILCLCFWQALSLLQAAAYRRALMGIQLVLALAAIALALLSFMDFLSARGQKYGRIRLQLPARLRAWNHRIIQRLRGVPAGLWCAFLALLGVVISGGEFLCAGQVTLATLLYLARSGGQTAAALPLFVLLQAIPMVAAVLLLAAGQHVFRLTEAARRLMPLAKLASALVFVAFAAYFITAL